MYEVDKKLADRISCFTRYSAEWSGYFKTTKWEDTIKENGGEHTYYDSVTGKPLFIAPRGRSLQEFIDEAHEHGWPSFRDEELVTENVIILANGETVSSTGTHLGHNLPDSNGNRYCIDLVSVSGSPV